MLINKITTGFVTQTWDTVRQRWVRQDFTAGDQCDYEDENGNAVDPYYMLPDEDEPYLPFDMVQPEPEPEPSRCHICGGPDH